MIEEYGVYLLALEERIPNEVFCVLIALLFLAALSLYCLKKWGRFWRGFIALALLEYIFLIYCSTILFRDQWEDPIYNFSLFWSYAACSKGGSLDIGVDMVMNVVLFIPIGLLLGISIYKIRWWVVLMIGICISFSIEVSQYFTHRGFSELDDIYHNTMGCMIGYGLYRMVLCIMSKTSDCRQKENCSIKKYF